MDGELASVDALGGDGVGQQPLGQACGLPRGDHPADQVPLARLSSAKREACPAVKVSLGRATSSGKKAGVLVLRGGVPPDKLCRTGGGDGGDHA
jgi:hypothetical protein